MLTMNGDSSHSLVKLAFVGGKGIEWLGTDGLGHLLVEKLWP